MPFKSRANRSAALPLSQAESSRSAEVISETLLMACASWDGAAYPQYPASAPMIGVLRISVPPHTVLAWHHHPVPAVGYLLSGELTIEKKDGNQQKTFVRGEAIAEVVNSVHRGIAGAEPVELLVFYAGGVGIPLSIICEA
ncbi:Cupin domain [Serratia entomophila]|nr:Cupin domain [Serratia entomophila]CAI0809856.1 Cupin domain [Serratia entomophila]CAI1584435.1 Cupin domain [Serratia entomophila]